MGKGNVAKVVWGVVILIFIVAMVALVPRFFNSKPADSTAAPVTQAPTRTAAPANVKVPNEGTTGVAAGVAVPTVQVAASANDVSSFRSFSITVSNNNYTPGTVIVNQGDTVNLKIVATDGNYGFNQPDYGLSSAISKGKTQTIQFQASQSGDFTFYCAACGGPAKGPVGHIIIAASK